MTTPDFPLKAEFPPIHPVTGPFLEPLEFQFEVRHERPVMWVSVGGVESRVHEIDRHRIAEIRDFFTRLLAEYPPLHEHRDHGGFGQMTGWRY